MVPLYPLRPAFMQGLLRDYHAGSASRYSRRGPNYKVSKNTQLCHLQALSGYRGRQSLCFCATLDFVEP